MTIIPQRRSTDGKKGISFDPRVTVGNLLSITTMLATVFVAYMNLKTDVAIIKEKQTTTANDVAVIKNLIINRGLQPAKGSSNVEPATFATVPKASQIQ